LEHKHERDSLFWGLVDEFLPIFGDFHLLDGWGGFQKYLKIHHDSRRVFNDYFAASTTHRSVTNLMKSITFELMKKQL
jgi:hypothetical protein